MVFRLSAPSAIVALLITVFASCCVPAARCQNGEERNGNHPFPDHVYLPGKVSI